MKKELDAKGLALRISKMNSRMLTVFAKGYIKDLERIKELELQLASAKGLIKVAREVLYRGWLYEVFII